MERFKLRCRRCRCIVLTQDEVVNSHGQSLQEKSCSNSSTQSVWYVSLEGHVFPWIQDTVDKASWTKGKLSCPKCHGRIGSFDFVSSSKCPCGQQTLPGVHILRDRVDQVKPISANKTLTNERTLKLTNQISVVSTPVDKPKVLNEQTPTIMHASSDTDMMECSDTLPSSNVPQAQRKVKQCEHYADSLQSRLQDLSPSSSPGMWYIEQDIPIAIIQKGSADVDSVQEKHCIVTPGCSAVLNCLPNNSCEIFTECSSNSMQNVQRVQDCLKPARQNDPCAASQGCFKKNDPSKSSASSDNHSDSFGPLRCTTAQGRQPSNPECPDSDLKARVKRKDLRRRLRKKKNTDVLDLDLTSLEVSENRFHVLPEEEISSEDDVLEDILDEHVCPVCLDGYFHPHTCRPCGHMFCESCLRQLAQKSDNSTSFPCPLCRNLIRACILQKELTNELKILYPELYKYRLVTDRKYLSRRFPLPQSTDRRKARPLNDRFINALSHPNFIQLSRLSVKGITFLGAVIFLLLVLCVSLAL